MNWERWDAYEARRELELDTPIGDPIEQATDIEISEIIDRADVEQYRFH